MNSAEKMTERPPKVMGQKDVDNIQGGATNSIEFHVGGTTTDTYSYTVNKEWGITVGTEVEIEVPLISSAKFKLDTSIKESKSNTQAVSVTKTWSSTFKFNVPPGCHQEAKA